MSAAGLLRGRAGAVHSGSQSVSDRPHHRDRYPLPVPVRLRITILIHKINPQWLLWGNWVFKMIQKKKLLLPEEEWLVLISSSAFYIFVSCVLYLRALIDMSAESEEKLSVNWVLNEQVLAISQLYH